MSRATLTQLCLILLCASFGVALGGGLYEHTVLVPLWSKAPPSSFAIIQPETGVPLQRFWIPVHAAITVFAIASLVLTWRQPAVRRVLALGLASYVIMRVWSALFFIPEMLAFQQIPTTSPSSPELDARVASWTFWSWFREPLDIISFVCALLAWRRCDRPLSGEAGQDARDAA